MKKILTIALTASLILAFAGCSNNAGNNSQSTSSNSSSKSDNNSSSTTDNNSTDKPGENKTITPAEVEAVIAKALGEGYLCTEDVPAEEANLSCIG